MFCPRCATENTQVSTYCRGCGQSLGDVQLALEGLPSESLRRLKAGGQWINGGIATILAFTAIAVIITILGISLGQPVLGAIAMLNELLGILIGVPLVLAGKVSTKRAARLLSLNEARPNQPTFNTQESEGKVTAGLSSQPARFRAAESVTENTTVNLREKLRS